MTLEIRIRCQTVADLVDVRPDGEDVLLSGEQEHVVRQTFLAITGRDYTANDVAPTRARPKLEIVR